MIRKVFFAGFAAVMMASSANAGIILGIFPDPPTTAGVPASTRSGPGTWHLYAIEDAASTDQGIASYNIVMNGTTAINHRSPNGTAMDVNGDVQNWGYTLLRSGTNANPIVASEPLTGTTPFVITGLGISAGTASTQILAADAAATGITAVSGGSWGSYLTQTAPGSLMDSISAANGGHKWVFLAEGLGAPVIPQVTGTFTVLSNAQGSQIAGTSGGPTVNLAIPEPATVSLIGLALVGGLGVIRRRR
jgi:hypothetical protein